MMNTSVNISVIVPIYGVENFIARFADSLLSQDYPCIQFIFVNDGTKDRSIEILRTLIDERYSHISDRILIIDKENEGCPKARRTGVEHATGDYIMHADPDDWYERDAFSEIAAVAQTTDADFIYFDHYKEYPSKIKLKRERDYTIGQKDEYIRNMYNHKSYGCVWNKCVKRSVYDNRIFYPPVSCAEDVCLTSQLLGYSSSIVHIRKPLYHYMKDNPTAVTKRNPRFRRFRAVSNMLGQYEYHKDMAPSEIPVSALFDDVMMKAGWSTIIYGFDFFRTSSYLVDNICHASLKTDRSVPLAAQIFTKLYTYIYRWLRR
jgi:glycosyltransferase involved in cell wall biosynthesis